VHDGTIVIDVNVVMLVEQNKQIITISISILEELEIFSPQGGNISETMNQTKSCVKHCNCLFRKIWESNYACSKCCGFRV